MDSKSPFILDASVSLDSVRRGFLPLVETIPGLHKVATLLKTRADGLKVVEGPLKLSEVLFPASSAHRPSLALPHELNLRDGWSGDLGSGDDGDDSGGLGVPI